jgi:hypothetical protein
MFKVFLRRISIVVVNRFEVSTVKISFKYPKLVKFLPVRLLIH